MINQLNTTFSHRSNHINQYLLISCYGPIYCASLLKNTDKYEIGSWAIGYLLVEVGHLHNKDITNYNR